VAERRVVLGPHLAGEGRHEEGQYQQTSP
jgi:hypothetical protein